MCVWPFACVDVIHDHQRVPSIELDMQCCLCDSRIERWNVNGNVSYVTCLIYLTLFMMKDIPQQSFAAVQCL